MDKSKMHLYGAGRPVCCHTCKHKLIKWAEQFYTCPTGKKGITYPNEFFCEYFEWKEEYQPTTKES